MIWLLILALVTLAAFIAAGIDDTRHNRAAAATPDRHRHRRTNGGTR